MRELAFALPTTPLGVLVLGVTLLVLWIVVSIPVYFSGKVITGGKADLGSAMSATLGGALVYLIILYAASFLFGPALGGLGILAAFGLAILAWLAVYRASFETSWIGAVGIVLVGWLVLVVLDALLVSLFGVSLPRFEPF